MFRRQIIKQFLLPIKRLFVNQWNGGQFLISEIITCNNWAILYFFLETYLFK